jgi:hypothetical protein
MRSARSAIAFSLVVLCAVSACTDDGVVSGEPFQLVFENLDGALMSVAGTSAGDVWAVGADTRDGKGALALHFDGERWTREEIGVEADLWWVRVFGRKSLFAGGATGTIVHYDGKTFAPMDTPGTSTVWGIWGVSEDDLWAVGGDPDVSPGFLWHFDGKTWSDATDSLPDGLKGSVLYKVWGQSSDDVWTVGMDGTAVHWNGKAWTAGDSGTDQRIFTVHGAPTGKPAFVAVGGYDAPVILERDGTRWHDAVPRPTPEGWPPQLYGVYMDAEEHGYAVGFEGAVLERGSTAWKLLDTGILAFNPLHSVWVDPDGGVWAVGGDVMSPTPSEGMLIHRGKAISNVLAK